MVTGWVPVLQASQTAGSFARGSRLTVIGAGLRKNGRTPKSRSAAVELLSFGGNQSATARLPRPAISEGSRLAVVVRWETVGGSGQCHTRELKSHHEIVAGIVSKF